MSGSDFEDFELPEPPAMAIGESGTLGQADIDALFGDVGAPPPQRSGLRAVVESEVVNHARLPMLEVICDRVLRTFATNMRNLTSDAIEVSLEETTSARFGEVMNRAALPAMFGVFRIEEWDNYGVVIVEPGLIYSVVDALLGGQRGGGSVRVEGRAFTTIETALVSRMIDLALSDFAAAFEPLAAITIKLERIETSPRFASIAGPSNVTALATFGVDMEGRGGRFSVLLPFATLEPVREKMLQRFMGEKMGSNSIWESHLQKEIGLTSVTVDAVLSEQFMRLADVQTFKVGQTLQLGRNADDCLELHCSGVRLARGQLGQRNSKVAIRVQSQIAGG